MYYNSANTHDQNIIDAINDICCRDIDEDTDLTLLIEETALLHAAGNHDYSDYL